MRKTLLLTAAGIALAIAPALAQRPAPAQRPDLTQRMDPATGARPGNIPGTNNSLPLGSNASNIDPSTTRSEIAPHLPTPSVGEDGSTAQYLGAARRAIAGRRTGEAQQALEMAETRALDRSTPAADAGVPDRNPMVAHISRALEALGHRDWAGATQMIDQAMAMTGGEARGELRGDNRGNRRPKTRM